MNENKPLAVTLALLTVLAATAAFVPGAMAAHGDSATLAVETDDARDVTDAAAWLQGNLTHLNESIDSASLSFEYWEAGDAENSTTVEVGDAEDLGTFEAHVTGLDNGTTYAYQAVAEAENTTVNGTTVEFTTAAREIVLNVETETPTNVTDSTATLSANLTELDGKATNTTVRFQYWVAGDRSTKVHTEAMAANGTGVYTTEATNLSANTEYVVRAHAETGASDLDYTADDRGAELTFETFSGEFEVETLDASDVTNSSATLNGALNGLDGAENASVSFTYWTENDSANTTSVDAGTLGDPGAFSAGVESLTNGTTYVYTAEASANGTNVTGENVTFTATTESAEETTWDGTGPFGQFVSSLVGSGPSEDSDEPFGQWLSDIIRENNPGNGQGPPENAGPPGDDAESDDDEESEDTDDRRRGPPEDKERGPPEDAGPSDDDSETDERGPPENAGPPEDKERGPPEEAGPSDDDEDKERGPPEDKERGPPEDKERGPPEDAGPNDDDSENETENDERGPPADAGPSDDDESEQSDEEDDESTDEDSESEADEADEADEEESEDDGSDEEDDDGGQRGPPEDSPGNGGGPPGNGGGPP